MPENEGVLKITQPVHIVTAASLEEMAKRLPDVFTEMYQQGCRVVSVSHAVDSDAAPGERYSALVVGETRYPRVESQPGPDAPGV